MDKEGKEMVQIKIIGAQGRDLKCSTRLWLTYRLATHSSNLTLSSLFIVRAKKRGMMELHSYKKIQVYTVSVVVLETKTE